MTTATRLNSPFCPTNQLQKRRVTEPGRANSTLRLIGALLLTIGFTVSATAQTFTTLYSFNAAPDAAAPYAGVVRDAKGNLYGTTLIGGNSGGICGSGCGTVFKVDAKGRETVLYRFTGKADGGTPQADVKLDERGNLYGTAILGGNSGSGCFSNGCGVVFKVSPHGKETVLYAFTETDGESPWGGVTRGPGGVIYGTTWLGGSGNCNSSPCGVVFELGKNGTEHVLHDFTGSGGDGANPEGDLARDANGNLYGSTTNGGDSECGSGNDFPCGIIFKVDKSGNETVLHNFTGAVDGANPKAGVILDANGNIYGTAYFGGAYNAGTVFKIDTSGQFTVLYTFTGGTDGGNPVGEVTLDQKGNLYGTTLNGGDVKCVFGDTGCGVVFMLDPTGKQTILHSFLGKKDGAFSYGRLTIDGSGNLYGTTYGGGAHGWGTVFEIKP